MYSTCIVQGQVLHVIPSSSSEGFLQVHSCTQDGASSTVHDHGCCVMAVVFQTATAHGEVEEKPFIMPKSRGGGRGGRVGEGGCPVSPVPSFSLSRPNFFEKGENESRECVCVLPMLPPSIHTSSFLTSAALSFTPGEGQKSGTDERTPPLSKRRELRTYNISNGGKRDRRGGGGERRRRRWPSGLLLLFDLTGEKSGQGGVMYDL